MIEELIMTKKQLAKRLQFTPRTIEVWMLRGFPYIKLGHRVRFSLRDVETYLKNHTVGGGK